MMIAWFFNFDADAELRNPVGYAPSASVQRRSAQLVQSLRGQLLPGEIVIPEQDDARQSDDRSSDFLGHAWCLTPRALARLARFGVRLPPHPALPILQKVNHRRFAAELSQTLPHSVFVESHAALRQHTAGHEKRPWLLKRPFGFSGRGHRRVSLPQPSPDQKEWIDASFRHEGGLLVEPLVQRQADFAVHGYIDEDREVTLGRLCRQVCDAQGAWQNTRLAEAGALRAQEHAALFDHAEESALALRAAGYFGPFGLDAYHWLDDVGARQFNPRSEINARYTMGWFVGMGAWRPPA